MRHAKIMFEIYRDTAYSGKHAAVFFTELNEGQKNTEIARAMTGEHVYDGFIAEWRSDEAKAAIAALCEELDAGAALTAAEITARLTEFAPGE